MNPTLQEHFERELRIASKEMEEDGSVAMRILIITDNDMGIALLYRSDHECCNNCGDKGGKNMYADLAQTCMVATNAKAYLFVSEAWFVESASPEGLRPAERADRRESVMVHAESRTETLMAQREVFRDGEAIRIGDIIKFDHPVGGRFANLLPKVAPSEEVRQMAQRELGDFLTASGYLK